MATASGSTALRRAAAAVGIDAATPVTVLEIAAIRLKEALEDGAEAKHKNVAALLLLISAARREVSKNHPNTSSGTDLSLIAASVDADTREYVNALGLSNATELHGADPAAQYIASSVSNEERQSERNVVPRRAQRKLRLLPKFANIATEQVLTLVRSDQILAAKAASQVAGTVPGMSVRRKKARGIIQSGALSRSGFTNPGASTSGTAAPMSQNVRQEPAANTLFSCGVSKIPISTQPLAETVHVESRSAARQSLGPSHEHASALYQPPATAVYQPPVSTNGSYFGAVPVPITPPVPSVVNLVSTLHSSQQHQVTGGGIRHEPSNLSEDVSQAHILHNLSTAQHGNTSVQPNTFTSQAWAPSLIPKSHTALVRDEECADAFDVMDGCMIPLERSFGFLYQHHDSSGKIRAILADRERILYTLAQLRQAELLALPEHVPEGLRRKAVIEGKQIKLIELQRVTRWRVASEHRKLFAPPPGENYVVPSDDLARFFRRRDPPVYSYTDGYPRISPIDGTPGPPPRSAQAVAVESARMTQFDYSRMIKQRTERHRSFLARLITHQQGFCSFHNVVMQSRIRIHRGLDRHWLDKKRQEEKRKKMEQTERLHLLRSNDEEAYLKLLKNTKNERLLQLVSQTDNYLMQIGAKVEKARDGLAPYAPAGANVFEQESESNNEDTVETLRRRRDMYYSVAHSITEDVKQPSIMINGTLKPYQIDGLRWMVSLYNNNLNGILADEMGLGKTIQTISLITYLIENKKILGPFLIIVPLSTLGNWVRELDLWAPSVVKVVYRGGPNTRRDIYETEIVGFNFNILLTTYEFVVRDQAVLGKIHWKYIIIDEGHRMKNANCKLAMTLGVRYRSRNRLLLTGTPLQNNLTELWALLNFLLPSIFSSSDTFEQWFKKPFEQTTLGDAAELEEEETYLIINRLHQVLRPFLLRRLKTDVESQLPDKVESVIRCDMSVWQRVLYRQLQNRIQLATGEGERNSRTFNNLLMQLKKICNHPFIFYGPEEIDKLPQDALVRSSGKFHLLSHVLAKLHRCGHRTLIFSQMTTALDYLEDFLSHLDVSYMRLDGSTNAEERQGMLNQFNAPDSPYSCFLLSTRAGGLGLNLQTADTVIIFDSDWNPMMDLQAQDRAHRIGQTREVRVFRLISSGTVEVKILEQANRKLQVDAQVIQAGQFNNKSTETDRETMLKSILRQRAGETDELGDGCLDLEDLNRVLARSEEEFEIYQDIDAERATLGTDTLMTEESELPAWVLQPEVDHKTLEEREREQMMSLGRGRRKHGTIQDVDRLTEREWISVMEGEMTVEEAFARRSNRLQRRERKNSTSAKSSGEADDAAVDDDADESFENCAATSEDDALTLIGLKTPKRKRGRPPKSQTAHRELSKKVTTGRKRGRPRRSVAVNGASYNGNGRLQPSFEVTENGAVTAYSETDGDDDVDNAENYTPAASDNVEKAKKRRKSVAFSNDTANMDESANRNLSRLSNSMTVSPEGPVEDNQLLVSTKTNGWKRQRLVNGHANGGWDEQMSNLDHMEREIPSKRVSARLRLRVRAPSMRSR